MNERIKELATQCGFMFDETVGLVAGPNASGVKLAKLVVQECAEIVTIWSEQEPCSEGYDITPVAKMKQYFGVE